jgi:hypothetical protein
MERTLCKRAILAMLLLGDAVSVVHTARVVDSRSIYRVLFGQPEVKLGRGDVVELAVTVQPADLPVEFKFQEPDPRVQVSVSPSTGTQRVVTFRDVTDETGPLAYATPQTLTLVATLPDGSKAVTQTAEIVHAKVGLFRKFVSWISDSITGIPSKIDGHLNTMNRTICNAIGSGFVAKYNELAAQKGEAPLTPTQEQELRIDINRYAEQFCNEFGGLVGDNVRISIEQMPLQHKIYLVRRDLGPPQTNVSVDLGLVYGGISLKVRDVDIGSTYSLSEFVNLRPFQITPTPIQTAIRTLEVNPELQVGDFKTRVTTSYSIDNDFGSMGINNVAVEFRFTFGGPQ